jgi:hypothetical protein
MRMKMRDVYERGKERGKYCEGGLKRDTGRGNK